MTLENDNQLQALKDFAGSENRKLVAKLEEILDDVGKTGQYIFPWHFMKPLYAHKLDQVTTQFLEASPPLNTDGSLNDEEIAKLKEFREELLQSFDKFVCAPFTIQRVTELLANPKKHYKTTAKFFRGLEKNIMVVSTIEMVTPEQRVILKRQHQDDPTEATHNGIGNELKPPIKKSATEQYQNGTNTETEATHNYSTHTLSVNECATEESVSSGITTTKPVVENTEIEEKKESIEISIANEEQKQDSNTESNLVAEDKISNEVELKSDESMEC